MTFISIRFNSELIDWWDAYVNGKQMNLVSIIYLISLTGMITCVFLKYYKK